MRNHIIRGMSDTEQFIFQQAWQLLHTTYTELTAEIMAETGLARNTVLDATRSLLPAMTHTNSRVVNECTEYGAHHPQIEGQIQFLKFSK